MTWLPVNSIIENWFLGALPFGKKCIKEKMHQGQL
jgi:hypothetical protein